MEGEKPLEFMEEVEIMEEEDQDCALQSRTHSFSKKKITDATIGEFEASDKMSSVFFDPTTVSDKNEVSDNDSEVSDKNEVSDNDSKLSDNDSEVSDKNEASDNDSPASKKSDSDSEVSDKNEGAMQLFAQTEKANGSSSPKGKELDTQENVEGQETHHNYNSNNELGNGSHSNGSHEVSNIGETILLANGNAGLKLITTIDESKNSLANSNGALHIASGSMNGTNAHEIEVENNDNVTKGKVKIEEYDLEKILDEQRTHDLYCPNCNSCITQRVILRKRKRTARQTLRDDPPKKSVTETQANASDHTVPREPESPEIPEPESPNIFRCLSCFTFFIPTGCDFNIFRIFGRPDVNQPAEAQHPAALSGSESENCGSWLLSCFKAGDSPRKPDADPENQPLLTGTQITSVTTSSVATSTASVHYQDTPGKPEEQSESSSQLQTTTTEGNGFKVSFSEFHATTVTSVASNTSAAANIISSELSETGFMKPDILHVVSEHQNGVVQHECQDNQDIGGGPAFATTTAGNGSLFGHPMPNPVKLVPGPVPVPGPEVVSSMSPHVTLEVVPSASMPVIPPPLDTGRADEWDILKAIVYGGLVELLTSLSVVSAAASSGAKTLDIFILGIANLIGGLPLIFSNIGDLRYLGEVDGSDEHSGHYWLLLGRWSKFRLHMVIAILSYLLFGLLPPVIYALSFRKVDDREKKMMAVAGASLAFIALLAIGKAHVKTAPRTRSYLKTVMYYLTIGVSASGLSYVAGVLITKLLEHYGIIHHSPAAAPAPPALFLFPDAAAAGAASAWSSY